MYNIIEKPVTVGFDQTAVESLLYEGNQNHFHPEPRDQHRLDPETVWSAAFERNRKKRVLKTDVPKTDISEPP